MTETLLAVDGLTKHFPVRSGLFGRATDPIRAVESVSFEVRRGETLALVGESGSGKTTTARLVLRLLEPTDGRVIFAGEEVRALEGPALKRFRSRAQIIFQDPFGSLNPRMSVGRMLGEALATHGIVPGGEVKRRVAELLDAVGLQTDDAVKYPHQFSGGQRQRIGIARALAVEPEFIVADEPVSALDVSVQAQVLNLLADLQERFHLTYLFISHDLSVVRQVADRVAVMYLGRLVELGPADPVFRTPRHPYTQALLSAVPTPNAAGGSRIALEGEVASPSSPPPGCPFHPRCHHPEVDETCRTRPPRLEASGAGVSVACHKVQPGPGSRIGQG